MERKVYEIGNDFSNVKNADIYYQMQTSSMPDAKILGTGHGGASSASKINQRTRRLVRARVNQVGKFRNEDVGGSMEAAAAQDGTTADGMKIIDEIIGAPDRLQKA